MIAMTACMAITMATAAVQPPAFHVSPGRIAPKPPPI